MTTYALVIMTATLHWWSYGPLEQCNMLAFALTQTATDIQWAQCVREEQL